MGHAELGQSTLMATFLQASDDSLARAKEEAKAAKPKLSTTAKAWFEGTVNTLANGKAELEKSAADLKVEEISQYIVQQEKVMAAVNKHVEAMAKRTSDLASAMKEAQLSLVVLGETEGEAISHGFSQMAATMDEIQKATEAHSVAETIGFAEPLQEYSRMLLSIKAAVAQRQDKKSAYMQALVDVEAKQAAHRKVMGAAGKEAQARAKEQAVLSAQEACEHARKDFERVSERLLSEFDAFKTQKAVDLKEVLLSVVTAQIDFQRSVGSAWSGLQPKVAAIATGAPAAAFSHLSASAPLPPASSAPAARPVSTKSDFQDVAEEDEEDLVGV